MLVDSHLMLSKHVYSVCKSAFFSVRNIGRIGKYFDRDKCLGGGLIYETDGDARRLA